MASITNTTNLTKKKFRMLSDSPTYVCSLFSFFSFTLLSLLVFYDDNNFIRHIGLQILARVPNF